MKIAKLEYNWFQGFDRHEGGEDYYVYEVGKKDVVTITEHPAQGDGDKWRYNVIFADGKGVRVFNPNKVYFDQEKSQ